MRHTYFLSAATVLAIATLLAMPPIASAEGMHGKRSAGRPDHGHGFLPGYEPPEVVEWRRAYTGHPAYWYGGPRFYRGRWNGGGFGPCWTQTPIGPHWNCG